MTTLQVAAGWAEFIGFALAIWNGIKLAMTASANAGTRLSKKVGTARAHTDGAIEYSNRLMKRQMIRIAIFAAIGLLGLLLK
jgi:hypothetical protein